MKNMRNVKILIGVLAAILALLIILLLPSFNTKSAGVKCTLKNDQSKSGYVLEATYEIYSKNNVVEKVEVNETITSKDSELLSSFEKDYKDQYDKNNAKYGGYSYNIKIDKDKLISKVTLNYSKMNLELFTENNEAMKQYLNKKNKLTLEGAKKMYESSGAICE